MQVALRANYEGQVLDALVDGDRRRPGQEAPCQNLRRRLAHAAIDGVQDTKRASVQRCFGRRTSAGRRRRGRPGRPSGRSIRCPRAASTARFHATGGRRRLPWSLEETECVPFVGLNQDSAPSARRWTNRPPRRGAASRCGERAGASIMRTPHLAHGSRRGTVDSTTPQKRIEHVAPPVAPLDVNCRRPRSRLLERDERGPPRADERFVHRCRRRRQQSTARPVRPCWACTFTGGSADYSRSAARHAFK